MITIQQLLRKILDMIQTGCEAEAVSFFTLLPTADGDSPLLIHTGPDPAVPQLTDTDTAMNLIRNNKSHASDPEPLSGSRNNCALLFVPSLSPAAHRNHDNIKACKRQESDTIEYSPSAWLGIRGGRPAEALKILESIGDRDTDSLRLAIGSLIGCRTHLICTGEIDSVSQLPTRSTYPIHFRRFISNTTTGRYPGLLVVNPDAFNTVNDQFNRERGDQILREIALRVRNSARSSDIVFRYGAAVFGVLLPTATPKGMQALAEKIQNELSETPYGEGAIRLSFSLGGAIAEPQSTNDHDSGAMELARRANAALSSAKRAGGNNFSMWSEAVGNEEGSRSDSLSGIFTADPAQDYRNMRLLWNTVRLIATATDVDEMKDRLLEEFISVFRLTAAGVFDEGAIGTSTSWKMLRIHGKNDNATWQKEITPEDYLKPIRNRVLTDGVTVAEMDEKSGTFHCMIPFRVGERILGGLYLEGDARLFSLNSGDLFFFEALSEQIAMALDRNRLTALELRQNESEQLRLKHELDELQNSIKRSSLIYRSDKMDELLRKAKRLATTDATLLINGESGTGKEVVARTMHQLSKRNKKPLVIVDCSAITTTLIDSELFGHERGAFTGAHRKSDGRLLEADGGTVLLDEIGELPLEVQSKLLRFVQDKQFTPVGSNQVKTVDVRVIALTNRDLAAEAKAGRFREDLFHRLNVMRLIVPPLRDRIEDVEYLAMHFIKKFSIRYDRDVTGLTTEGRSALLGHDWPGNVRELQNRIMRSVVLADSDLIGPEELELLDQPTESPDRPVDDPLPMDDVWEELRQSLSETIDEINNGDAAHPPPIGKWVHEDMILEACRLTGDVTSRGAALLGIPETTFRRKHRAATGNIVPGIPNRPADWQKIHGRIAAVLESGNPDREDLLELARACILTELEGKISGNVRTGAAFMGITETTFRKWAEGQQT